MLNENEKLIKDMDLFKEFRNAYNQDFLRIKPYEQYTGKNEIFTINSTFSLVIVLLILLVCVGINVYFMLFPIEIIKFIWNFIL